MDSNDSSANTTITFGDAAVPAQTTSGDEHLTVSSSSDGKGKKRNLWKRCAKTYSGDRRCKKNLDHVQVHPVARSATPEHDHQVPPVPLVKLSPSRPRRSPVSLHLRPEDLPEEAQALLLTQRGMVLRVYPTGHHQKICPTSNLLESTFAPLKNCKRSWPKWRKKTTVQLFGS